MKYSILSLYVALLFIMQSYPVFGQIPALEKNKLIIGIKESPPFVMKSPGGGYTGLCVDLWEEVAHKMNMEYELRYFDDLSQLLGAIENNEVDISINPLTVTSDRLKRFSFSQPFYISNLAIAVRAKSENGTMAFLRNVFSKAFIQVLGFLFLVIFIFGFVLWLVERHRNPKNFSKGLGGVGDGIWWSAVTMTTVGYGDKAPITPWGRAISIVWMFTAVIIISSFTASISAALTYNKFQSSIKNIDDLRNVAVGTVNSSSSAEYLLDRSIRFKGYETLDEALAALNRSELAAVVYDEPLLAYLIPFKKYDEDIELIPNGVNSVYFSFAGYDYMFLNRLNPVLIELIESNIWKLKLEKYKLTVQ
nr:transporter substrate-binding domain-containing protein [Bacteroidota bacterium]